MIGSLHNKKIKRLFDVYDTDNDGELTKNDFERLGYNFSKIRKIEKIRSTLTLMGIEGQS